MEATASTGSLLRERFPELVGGMVVGGFALTLGELLLMNHTEKIQAIGVGLTAVGMAAVALGLMAVKLRKLMVGVLLIVAAGGLFGTYEHVEHANEEREKAGLQESALVIQNADYDATEADEGKSEDHEKDKKHGPPPLAPLSVSGLALMGGLGLLASKR